MNPSARPLRACRRRHCRGQSATEYLVVGVLVVVVILETAGGPLSAVIASLDSRYQSFASRIALP